MTLRHHRTAWATRIGGACAAALVTAGVTAAAPAGGGHQDGRIRLSIVPDSASAQPSQVIGYTITVSNAGPRAAQHVTLTDRLPAGDLSWALDSQGGITGCVVTGAAGQQAISCPAVSLAPGAAYRLHIFSHTYTSTVSRVVDTVTAQAAGSPAVTRSAEITVAMPSCLDSKADPARALLFDDEFSSDAGIDTAKWNVGSLPFPGLDGSTHYHNRQYGSYVVPQDSFIKDGVLNLTTNDVPVTNPDVPAIGTIPYTEGMVNTKGKFATTGGYFEMCAKFPAGKGLWPAFWLVAENGNWPPEIDVAEWFGSLQALQIGQPWATGAPPVWQTAGSKWLSTWRYSDAPTTGYHDYAVWWSPGSASSPETVRYYIDGQMVHEIDGTTADLIPDTPMYMILNSGTWAGSTRGGPPDATTAFPNAFQIRYVRVYTAPPTQNTNLSAP